MMQPNLIRRFWSWLKPADATVDAAYHARLAKEQEIYADQIDVHALPEIFHYWSNRYLLPMEQAFGFLHPEDFIAKSLLEAARGGRLRAISIGCGNCDAEVRVAAQLRAAGHEDFVIECMDINANMLERGAQLAAQHGLDRQVLPVRGDFNAWRPDGAYDAVIANQSLHHVLALESLFDAVSVAIGRSGRFVVSDMIGRNGHQRWPEARAIVHEFWDELPAAYRYNLQLKRQEDVFLDWDCSVEGFEGIRAQDVLPLCVERFGFELFLPFANVVDPFIDRSFGHHFDANAEWDRGFIDRVHARDEAAIRAGLIKPTHVMAVLTNDRGATPRIRDGLTPAGCVRAP